MNASLELTLIRMCAVSQLVIKECPFNLFWGPTIMFTAVRLHFSLAGGHIFHMQGVRKIASTFSAPMQVKVWPPTSEKCQLSFHEKGEPSLSEKKELSLGTLWILVHILYLFYSTSSFINFCELTCSTNVLLQLKINGTSPNHHTQN